MNETTVRTLIHSRPAETLTPVCYTSFDVRRTEMSGVKWLTSCRIENRGKTFGRPSNAMLRYQTKEPLFSPSDET